MFTPSGGERDMEELFDAELHKLLPDASLDSLGENQQVSMATAALEAMLPVALPGTTLESIPIDVLALIMYQLPNTTLRAFCRVNRRARENSLSFARKIAVFRNEGPMWVAFLARQPVDSITAANAMEALASMELVEKLYTSNGFGFELWSPKNEGLLVVDLRRKEELIYMVDVMKVSAKEWQAAGFPESDIQSSVSYGISLYLTEENRAVLERLIILYMVQYGTRVRNARGKEEESIVSGGFIWKNQRRVDYPRLEKCIECNTKTAMYRASNNASQVYCSQPHCQAAFYAGKNYKYSK